MPRNQFALRLCQQYLRGTIMRWTGRRRLGCWAWRDSVWNRRSRQGRESRAALQKRRRADRILGMALSRTDLGARPATGRRFSPCGGTANDPQRAVTKDWSQKAGNGYPNLARSTILHVVPRISESPRWGSGAKGVSVATGSDLHCLPQLLLRS
jgi:hypothetical protein